MNICLNLRVHLVICFVCNPLSLLSLGHAYIVHARPTGSFNETCVNAGNRRSLSQCRTRRPFGVHQTGLQSQSKELHRWHPGHHQRRSGWPQVPGVAGVLLAWGEVALRLLHRNFSGPCSLDFGAVLNDAPVEPAVAGGSGALSHRARPPNGNGQGG